MKKRILILLFVLIATRLYALINIGSVSDFKDLSKEKQNRYIIAGQLAQAAYQGEAIPPGYRPATRAEYNKYIGLVSQTMVYNPQTGHFEDGAYASKDNNGLAGSLLINEQDGSIVLAFRGTEIEDFADIKADVKQFLGGTPEQYKIADLMLGRLIANTEAEGTQILNLGHSLGGGEATYAALRNYSSRVTTITFNAAGLNEQNIRDEDILNPDIRKRITNIRVKGDVVSQTGLLVGNTYEVTNYLTQIDYSADTFTKALALSSPIFSGFVVQGEYMNKKNQLYYSHLMNYVMGQMIMDTQKKETGNNIDEDNGTFSDGETVENGDSVYQSSDAAYQILLNGGTDSQMVENGDLVCQPSDDNNSSDGNAIDGDDITDNETSSNDEFVEYGDMCLPPDDNHYITEEGNNENSDDVGNIVAGWSGIKEVFDTALDETAIVGPTIPHKRVLWLFSGESLLDSITSLWNGVTGNAEYKNQESTFEALKGKLQ